MNIKWEQIISLYEAECKFQISPHFDFTSYRYFYEDCISVWNNRSL